MKNECLVTKWSEVDSERNGSVLMVVNNIGSLKWLTVKLKVNILSTVYHAHELLAILLHIMKCAIRLFLYWRIVHRKILYYSKTGKLLIK